MGTDYAQVIYSIQPDKEKKEGSKSYRKNKKEMSL